MSVKIKISYTDDQELTGVFRRATNTVGMAIGQ